MYALKAYVAFLCCTDINSLNNINTYHMQQVSARMCTYVCKYMCMSVCMYMFPYARRYVFRCYIPGLVHRFRG